MSKQILISAICISSLFFCYSCTEPATAGYRAIAGSTLGTNNNSVHMAGCKTFHFPQPPLVVYKTVSRNFMTLPCALEVPPPFNSVEVQKLIRSRP